ncbi:US7 [anatid alphaherpesvirus 1]|uniref:Envelope glycoprotein I n=1 Tax=anatid alphaherpesvirus 1 TaxID=104388 RepID=E7D251_9ALPH|nr:US7 [Anatid alphaherpesvirus 1]AGS78734.1 US7 [Anatid alphaherpesvirus 1]AGW24864.1 US7 [Anatid alphaherpesvirus 1]AHD45995.1 US7 [BAC cloning vector pDEV-vac]
MGTTRHILILVSAINCITTINAIVYAGTSVSLYLQEPASASIPAVEDRHAVYGKLLFLGSQAELPPVYNGTVELLVYNISRHCYSVAYAAIYDDCPRLGATAFKACRHATRYFDPARPHLKDVLSSTALFVLDSPSIHDSGIYYIRVSVNDAVVPDVFKTTVIITDKNNAVVPPDDNAYEKVTERPPVGEDFGVVADVGSICHHYDFYSGVPLDYHLMGISGPLEDDKHLKEEVSTEGFSTMKPVTVPTTNNYTTLSDDMQPTHNDTNSGLNIFDKIPNIYLIPAVMFVVLPLTIFIVLMCSPLKRKLCRCCTKRRVYTGSTTSVINQSALDNPPSQDALESKHPELDGTLMRKLEEKLAAYDSSGDHKTE